MKRTDHIKRNFQDGFLEKFITLVLMKSPSSELLSPREEKAGREGKGTWCVGWLRPREGHDLLALKRVLAAANGSCGHVPSSTQQCHGACWIFVFSANVTALRVSTLTAEGQSDGPQSLCA